MENCEGKKSTKSLWPLRGGVSQVGIWNRLLIITGGPSCFSIYCLIISSVIFPGLPARYPWAQGCRPEDFFSNVEILETDHVSRNYFNFVFQTSLAQNIPIQRAIGAFSAFLLYPRIPSPLHF